ncbi:MAG: FeoB-associated Cys-rich membrane protein [Acetatifactor sp.]|nr:FeoB-associated Cys-rich membrane protein [Acetatifactor sp.]
MGMADFIVILIILAVVILAVWYIAKEKKKGNGCIGCPNASACGGSCHCDHKELTKE